MKSCESNGCESHIQCYALAKSSMDEALDFSRYKAGFMCLRIRTRRER